MDVIAEARGRVSRRWELRFTETPTSIEVAPPIPGGFAVALCVEAQGFMVYFAGWRERFESGRDALNCFSYGLMGDCRLRVAYRGKTACSWTLENHRGSEWAAESTTRRWLFPFWRSSRVEYLCNRSGVAAVY